MNVAEQRHALEINDGFIRACAETGIPRNDDFNGAEQYGVGYYQVTQRDKERCSAASAYLRPAVERNSNNVHVVSNALVERIILDQDRAMGVRYVVDGRDEVARCSREIILSGGAVNSPQLLMLSGIGPADHLNVARHPAPARPAGRRRQPAGPSRCRHPAVRQARHHVRPLEQVVGAVPVPREQEGPRHVSDRRIRAASSTPGRD